MNEDFWITAGEESGKMFILNHLEDYLKEVKSYGDDLDPDTFYASFARFIIRRST